jgi:PKD repeat protein
VNPFVAGNNAPTLTQPADMTVAEGATADQTITATDPDGDALTFSKVAGPAFVTVTTTTAGTGTGTGNIHLAPGFSDAGTYSVTVRASDGSLSDDKTLTVTVTNVNRAPDLNPIANMTVTEGATADQTVTGSDPDGDALTFTKGTGPAFMTVTTTNATSGNIHLAPGAATAGTYAASVVASDGSLTDTESFVITVSPAAGNQAPVADAGGPYSGTVGVAVTFSGAGSTDPDGDALTYAWDFDATNGIQVEATGVSPQHTYGAPGTYTVTLTVSDGTLSDSDTAIATITAGGGGGFEANAEADGGDKVIRLNSNRPFWCVDLSPINHNFRLQDVIVSSIRLTYNGVSIPALETRRLVIENGELQVCFGKDQLRTLLASLGNGRHDVTLEITGDLQGGGTFHASVTVAVQKGGPVAEGHHGHGHGDDFCWASPNPLNPSTTISFALTQPGSVRLAVYDVSGRLVNTLANRFMEAGIHDVRWDGTSRTGGRVASGVYFYVLQTPERTVKSQLVVAK